MYITAEQLKGFDDNYKYSCVDTSPLANYIMHPFWNQFVKIFPKWLAPNVMTFVGFILLVIQYGIFVYYDPIFRAVPEKSYIPVWVWYFSVFAQFFSHTLDGCDGKQARRTSSSSPLGELFDHGLDSWNTAFFVFNAYTIFGVDVCTIYELYLVYLVTMIGFLASHWEKYNTGVLFLPWAYDMSQVGLLLLYMALIIFGLEAVVGFEIFGYALPRLFEFSLFVGVLVASIPQSLYNVYVAYRDDKGKQCSFYEAILPLFSPFILIGLFSLWAFISPSDVLVANPRLIFFAVSVSLSNILCRLIVAQMSGTRCQALNAFIPLVTAGLLFVAISRDPTLDMYALWAVTVITTLLHIHYGVNVVNTLAEHFGIRVFHIKYKEN